MPLTNAITQAIRRVLGRPTTKPAPPATSPRPGRKDLDIRPAATEEEVQAIRTLITGQIPEPGYIPLPKTIPSRHNHLHRELIGAWSNSDLIGAAFIGPDEQEAEGLKRHGFNDDAHAILDNIAMIHNLAVEPTHRRTGVATALKHWLHTWARDHGAHLVISIPTTQAARNLNKATGYILQPSGITLIMQIKTNGRSTKLPADKHTTWAFHVLTDTTRLPISIGIYQPLAATSWASHDIIRWDVLDDT